MPDDGKYWDDGFCGGSEYSGDVDIDRMIYPERPPKPREKTPEEWQAFFEMSPEERRAQELREQEAAERARYDRDRDFRIEPGNPTGEHPGPPRTP